MRLIHGNQIERNKVNDSILCNAKNEIVVVFENREDDTDADSD